MAMADQEIVTKQERPWEELTMPEKLGRAADLSLDRVYQTLQLPCDGSDPKLLALVTNAALTVISQQVRVDTTKLTVSALSPAGLTAEERRERARQAIREAFAERPVPGDSGVKSE